MTQVSLLALRHSKMVREVTLPREAAEIQAMYFFAWKLVTSSHASPTSPSVPSVPSWWSAGYSWLLCVRGHPEEPNLPVGQHSAFVNSPSWWWWSLKRTLPRLVFSLRAGTLRCEWRAEWFHFRYHTCHISELPKYSFIYFFNLTALHQDKKVSVKIKRHVNFNERPKN